MKRKNKELDVDFLGGQEPLTKEEEQKISEYFLNQKQQKEKKAAKTKNMVTRKKAA